MSYEDWQLQKIRDAIRAFRILGQREGGAEYSWPVLTEEIKDVTGIEIPNERLRKFVEGEPCRGSDKTSLNLRHYPSLSTERLEAAIAFVTRKDSDGYMFSRKDLEIKPDGLSTILQFAEHLTGNRHSERISDASSLFGYFIADQNPADISMTTSLRFRGATHKGLVSFVLLKEYVEGIKTSELSKYKLKKTKEVNHTFERYEGWGIMTPEETIIFLSKKCESGENLLYITLGIDKALYFSQPANALVLLEIDQPEDSLLVELDSDINNASDLLENVREVFSQQLLLFKRKQV